ncbi:MAG TPA: FAD-dependent oxidoreductase [Vicinamibacterales bacterium]|nr:FAD-dependent oxidoreductase [Vicinamibacterales bacterium]
MRRRDLLKTAAALPAVAALGQRRSSGPRVAVIGAGAFGGWTALHLVRRGARVTLIDAWGPGNARASSGGETRVIRGVYGDRAIYTAMAARALPLWREHDRRFGTRFFRRTGALWMVGADDTVARESVGPMKAAGLPLEQPSIAEARRRWPQISFDGLSALLFEPEAGYLLARRAAEHVAERVVDEGGDFRQAAVATPRPDGQRLASLALAEGASIDADAFVFACGPWLGRLFPDVIGERVRSTRQEVYYFGTPPGDRRFTEDEMPVWVDYRDRLIYGIPGNAARGFKIADDARGPDFDPSTGERTMDETGLKAARAFLSERFPALAGAPFLGSEVCQYENSPDGHFIIDRHPAASNMWIVGGGSGHGYKMGPALGELVAGLVIDDGTPDPAFQLSRFTPRDRR